LVDLYQIFSNNVFGYEEYLWKISLQTNKYAKSYCVGVHIRQSASSVFDWMTHICVIAHPVHLNVGRMYVSISTEVVNDALKLM